MHAKELLNEINELLRELSAPQEEASSHDVSRYNFLLTEAKNISPTMPPYSWPPKALGELQNMPVTRSELKLYLKDIHSNLLEAIKDDIGST